MDAAKIVIRMSGAGNYPIKKRGITEVILAFERLIWA